LQQQQQQQQQPQQPQQQQQHHHHHHHQMRGARATAIAISAVNGGQQSLWGFNMRARQ
jgi:hypothetical protein